ncbi:hypothetical protein BpHYR1_015267 [Brachionus plicatilis]|uniref:Uncharacterized protein n=1 Tax=Brachionus plicatilis TaxID=10195 RepID=A0A3M7QER1_BRAPC|nr:hypothetical protein BpHYR1_015267 [Brachionus plicatilis]
MTLYKCAVCSIRFDKNSKASVIANRNKIPISCPWLVHLMQKPNQNITEDIETVPSNYSQENQTQ